MIRIALVGDIGSGKSYVAKQFGFPVFNADIEVKKLYKKSRKCYKRLQKALPNYITSFPVKKDRLSDAIIANDKKLMVNLSQEIANLSSGLSQSIKEESGKLGKSIAESGVVTSAKLNKEISKIIHDNKKNQNTKILKELSNSTSSLNAALEAGYKINPDMNGEYQEGFGMFDTTIHNG